MTPVWNASESGSIALRLRSGADVHCATLTYPVATRIAMPSMGIDLPVVYQPGNAFPWCNVAMYLPGLSQPGEAGVTFLYAHARTGMFLPLLTASRVNNGARMLGMKVYVYTSDDHLYTYQVTRVLRHQYVLPDIWSLKGSQVWLQTSEGPYGTYNKLMVVAQRISVTAASHADAHPTARAHRVQPVLITAPTSVGGCLHRRRERTRVSGAVPGRVAGQRAVCVSPPGDARRTTPGARSTTAPTATTLTAARTGTAAFAARGGSTSSKNGTGSPQLSWSRPRGQFPRPTTSAPPSTRRKPTLAHRAGLLRPVTAHAPMQPREASCATDHAA